VAREKEAAEKKAAREKDAAEKKAARAKAAQERKAKAAKAKKEAQAKRTKAKETKPKSRVKERRGGPLDVNKASFEQLRELGMSVTQATRVIAYREREDGFSSLDDLDAVPGFPKPFLAEIKEQLSA
jgi:DNA uptake protein ComE-like DNA-binding protein